MKTRHRFQPRPGRRTMEPAETYHIESSPNSSVILAVTVPADIEDILAVIRTAILLGKSFKVSIDVDLPGEDPIYIQSGGALSEAFLSKTFDSVQEKLCKQGAQAPVFTLEASITTASFLAAGTISVHIRATDSVAKRPTVAR